MPHRTHLHAASIVGNHTAADRATQGASQQYITGPRVQRWKIASQCTSENQIASGRRDADH